MFIIQCFLPEFFNTCLIFEHNLKSKQWIGLKFCTYVCNRLILKLKKFQFDSINISKVIKKNREGGGGKFTPPPPPHARETRSNCIISFLLCFFIFRKMEIWFYHAAHIFCEYNQRVLTFQCYPIHDVKLSLRKTHIASYLISLTIQILFWIKYWKAENQLFLYEPSSYLLISTFNTLLSPLYIMQYSIIIS